MAAGIPADCGFVNGMRRAGGILPCAVLLLAVSFATAAPQTAASENADETPYRISVDVRLVLVNPVVRDKNGAFVSTLGEGDFKVYEDGVLQSIRLFRHEDIPVTVGLVVDHSGSMRQKIPEVIEAVRTFARSSNQADEVFVLNFNDHVALGMPGPMRFSNRPAELEAAVSGAPAAGQTSLYDAVIDAQARLGAGTLEKKVLIVISDGGDNASRHSLAEALKISAESGAIVYTIGIFEADDEDRNPGVLRQLARSTGGEAFFPHQLPEVVAICGSIAHDIRNQYTLGYVSGNTTKPGAWRTISRGDGGAGARQTQCSRQGRILREWSRKESAGAMKRVAWMAPPLFVLAAVLLGYCAFVLIEGWQFQRAEDTQLEQLKRAPHTVDGSAAKFVSTGLHVPAPSSDEGLIGRLEIPRLAVSVIVMEGTGRTTLRHAIGHIAGMALPGQQGNVGIAGHRDTFFRPLRNIKQGDIITLTTTTGLFRYRVASMDIVDPSNTAVLGDTPQETLTLVTCYPFYFAGPAPDRFIVRAERIRGE